MIDEITSSCLKCQRYRQCFYGKGKLWYTYEEIRYCPFQVMWIIENSTVLGEGEWPTDPISGCTDPSIRSGIGSEPPFVKPLVTLADVMSRLRRTGADGKLLQEQVENGKSIGELASEAYTALMYVKGFRLKRMFYVAWKKQREYRKEVR